MKLSILSVFILFSFSAFSQTIFTIDGDDVSLQEFERMYEKSQISENEKNSKQSIDEYLDLFVKYKIKLKEAQHMGLDKDPEVLREIAIYEDQLIRNEFDEKVMNNLMAEAKTRLNEEVCMRHILIDIPGRYRGTADTIYSYKEAMKIKSRLQAGEKFEDLAKKNSRDMETKYSGGDLGCFTTLQLSNYALENQAYGMKRGEISDPIRTHLGYHIIEVTDRRPSSGLVSATQLFIRSNSTMENEQQYLAKKVIDSAYNKLYNDADFDEVADWLTNRETLQTSVDDVPQFMVGSYEKEFENGIFNIKEVGEFSRPIETSLGWHIFKLNSRDPLPDFEDIKGNIRDKITEDDRYNLSRMKFSSELKSRYNFVKVDSVIQQYKKDVAFGISYEGWLLPSGFDYNQPFFIIEDRPFSASEFSKYVKEQHELEKYRDFQVYYDAFETNQLLTHHKHNLIETDPEMKLLLEEYRNGIILFNMMEQETWRSTTTKDQEVKGYYEEIKESFRYPNKVGVKVYTTKEAKAASKITSILKNNKGEYALRKVGKKQPFSTSKIELLEEDANIYGQNLWEIGTVVKRMNDNGEFEILMSENTIEGESKPYEEVKTKVLTAYQIKQETDWVNKMKQKHNIKINQAVVNSLYK